MIDAKLAGANIEDEVAPAIQTSNVIDLMAALRKSLGGPVAETAKPAKPARKAKAPTAEETRRQPAFKLPIEGGKKKLGDAEVVPAPVSLPTSKPRRKAG